MPDDAPAPLARAPVAPPAPGARPPLLLLLHGLGGTEHAIFGLRHYLAPEFAVVSVPGLVSVAHAPDRFRPGVRFGARARGWFTTHDTPEGRQPAAADLGAAWEAVATAARDAVAAHDADPARVLVAGFSQGAMTALAALLVHPELFAGAAVLGGRLLPGVVPHVAVPERLAGRAVLLAHGTGDPRVPVEEARAARAHLGALPLALTYAEVPARSHAVTPAMRRHLAAWAAGVAGVEDREARPAAEGRGGGTPPA
jgi:phospholipase/carboxylesterase